MTAFVIAKNAMVITLQVNAFIAIEKDIGSVPLMVFIRANFVILHSQILVLSCIRFATAESCGVEK